MTKRVRATAKIETAIETIPNVELVLRNLKLAKAESRRSIWKI